MSFADTQPHPLPSAPSDRGDDAGVTVPGSLDALWEHLHAAPTPRARRLGEALIQRGLITPETLTRALQAQTRVRPHRLLGQLLVDAGALTPPVLNMALARWLGVPVVDPRRLTPEPDALARIPAAEAEREGVLPLMLRDDTLVVAVPDPWDTRLLDELRFIAQLRVQPVIAVPGTLAAAVARAYRDAPAAPAATPRSARELAAELAQSASAEVDSDAAVVSESDNTLVRLVNRMIADAIEQRASDIHVETADAPRPVRIRLRVDGDLVRYLELPARYRYALVARLKIMASLDISEHRKPQDGKIDFARFGGPHVELRMVTVPTVHGLEDVVLRLLSGLKPLPLDAIGLSEGNLAALRSVMAKPYGLILICGPTGSGKTTTLHSVLRELNTEQRKIWTAEDPVEITQEGLRQVQVNARIGWTFAAAMRTFLRADPDVIMIGEMRDEETARIAVEASLTGHLVMSTLHTNSAPESITRLLEIGLDPFTFSDSLLAILAQRLVRRLCTACRVREVLDDGGALRLARQYLDSGSAGTLDEAALVARWRRQHGDAQGRLYQYRRHGCARCDGSGYHGRLGLHELMLADDAARELIRHRAPAAQLHAAALAAGMVTLRQDGIEKMLAGLTDLAEVLAASNQ
ncbi:GspE/PulE family protein [Azohydromonas sediminis]|uniref:GspE/PulE family protein n=1 Tax=Azohydromonas sediminis TaxID=2259674 RepID=UPI000E656E09|nr:GspE/PulE family protein [Azohydromonas sediminis]